MKEITKLRIFAAVLVGLFVIAGLVVNSKGTREVNPQRQFINIISKG